VVESVSNAILAKKAAPTKPAFDPLYKIPHTLSFMHIIMC
jgi:hypothetical protein